MASSCILRFPSDLLSLILSHLPIAEYIRAGIVCRSWRKATAGKPFRRWNAESPLLMFPGVDEDFDDPDSYRIFSVADLTNCRFRLPQIRGKQIAGSSLASIVAAGPTEILLLDPFTGDELRLPPLALFKNNGKLIFSPSSSMAAAICTDDSHKQYFLNFARVGDPSWTRKGYSFQHYHFSDVIIHRGEFYVVDHRGWLLSIDPAAGGKFTFHGYVFHYFSGWNPQITRLYLAEWLDGDHLLLVCRRMDEKSWMTESFKVFRQDKVGRQWVLVGNLDEVAIFVGSNYSTCIFTRGLPELRGNCVYFTEDRTLRQSRGDFGVFNLDDGSIEQFTFLQHIRPSRPPPFWIMPGLS